MTRTKKSAKKGRPSKEAAPAATSSPGPTNSTALIEKAHILLGQSNFELAIKFLLRALEVEPDNLEARELVGVAELEGGDADVGREHLLRLFPPHTAEPPSEPSAYLYLAQSAQDPHEALGYYSTAAAMIEKTLSTKSKSKAGVVGADETADEERKMATTALVAMIEIWMSDLCFEPEAEGNCDALISRALAISPNDIEVRVSLASIRMSQSKFHEAKEVALSLFEEIDEKEPFDATAPALPTRLTLVRQLLEHSLHLEALSLLATAREEDSLEVESAYLEGWSWFLRAEAIEADPSLVLEIEDNEAGDEETGSENMSAKECYEESMRALLECAKSFAEQDYPDDGIGGHVKELLESLGAKGIKAPVVEDEAGENGDGVDWEDVDEVEQEDVEMA